jgi:nitrite reductase/ring-hydroxylating ferredoxin subunit
MTDVQTRTGADPQNEPAANVGCAAGTRRAVLAGAGGLGAACLLAACGTSSGGTATGGTNPNGSDYQANPAPAGSGKANANGGGTTGGATTGGGKNSGGGTAATLAAVEEVPEGGGVIKGKYVITQPEKGTFKAFRTVCPHAQCTVGSINNGEIICPCHGSRFSVSDGSVKRGPAQTGLSEQSVKVADGKIVSA